MGQRTRDERLERYLQWRRERGDDARVDGRSWWRRAGVALAFMLVAVSVLAWPVQHRHAIRHTELPASATKPAEVAVTSPQPPSASTETAPTPVPAPDASDRVGLSGPSQTETAAATAPAPQSRTQSELPATTPEPEAPSRVVLQGQDRAARETAPPEATSSERAVSVPAAAMLQLPVVSDSVMSETEPPSAVPPSRKSVTLIAKGSCASPRTQRIADCVGGWLEGEVQEFRDGFNRELEEFRAGVDKVGRGLQWLGDKLRR